MEDDSSPGPADPNGLHSQHSRCRRARRPWPANPRAGSIGLHFSRGWDESTDRRKGYFESRWGAPRSWNDVILQGPHLYVSTPMYKSVNPTMKKQGRIGRRRTSRRCLQTPFLSPHTNRWQSARYDADYTHWGSMSARSYYRIAWRAMAANVGERTLIPALIPPGAAHVHGVFLLLASLKEALSPYA